MSIDSLHADVEALAQARAEGRPLDPDTVKRIKERAENARREEIKVHGLQNIGVDLIRQARDSVQNSD